MTVRSVVLLAAALVCGSLANAVGEQARTSRLAKATRDDLMYLPESRVLRAASLGYTNVMADFIWLRAIQYYGEHRLTDRNYPQAERLFQSIYDLDPAFKGATRFGALILAQDAGDPSGALELLGRAENFDPRSWEYPFDQGFIRHTIVRDYAAASRDYTRASMCNGAPDLAARLAGLSASRLGDRDAAREVWRQILNDPPNDLTRRIAERGLKNLEIEEMQEVLTSVVVRFRDRHGRLPKSWHEPLQEGLLTSLPQEPFGGAYLYDPQSSKVRSTTTIDREMNRQATVITNLLPVARQKLGGSYPGTIEEMVRLDILDAAPSRPLGIALTYDPGTGMVSWDPPWPRVEGVEEEGG
jgi:tetratricopeptide (TPR) repeat protein